MSSLSHSVRVVIGTDIFPARLQRDLAPASCTRLLGLLPYRAKVIHARWSGEAFWSPLAAVWPRATILPSENATGFPAPGQIILFAREGSEPELLLPYGTSRFACKAGPIAGNPVLSIENGLARLTELGREILWHGAKDFCIEIVPHHSGDEDTEHGSRYIEACE
jgi:hypothetical protein